jgi:hypothetical protein
LILLALLEACTPDPAVRNRAYDEDGLEPLEFARRHHAFLGVLQSEPFAIPCAGVPQPASTE